jgi:hypothetical protein
VSTSVTLEKIDNGFVVYSPMYKADWSRTTSSNPVVGMNFIGTAREYFPTLQLALDKIIQCFPERIIPEGAQGPS